jgi:hypothetical protein
MKVRSSSIGIYQAAHPDKPSFELEPACRFVRTSDGGPDLHGLAVKIKYEKEVKALYAGVYLNSIIYGETAGEVELGFVGEKKELIDRLSDTELFARFLLDPLL